MNVSVVMGTRPGIIKMAPVFMELEKCEGVDVNIVYTGQHYSENLKDYVWKAFSLPDPSFLVTGIEGKTTHTAQLATMMLGCETAFLQLKSEVVLVCGDANTNLAAGLVARKMDLVLGHVESGLRSYDWRMPEEHNRIILDHISDYLFAPTMASSRILEKEQVKGNIYMVGNTVVDALMMAKRSGALHKPDGSFNSSDYIIFTAHRQENVDNKNVLKNFVHLIMELTKRIEVVFPMHPRTEKMLRKFGLLESLQGLQNLTLTGPYRYFEMLWLIDNARLLLTDSGGLQEEACILKTKCFTLRENTERPETLEIGANKIVGTSSGKVLPFVIEELEKQGSESWDSPFGDGFAARKIVDVVRENG